jgi:sec-independent protein translocase protein TatC
MAAATTTPRGAEEARMTLVEHLRELRNRVFKGVLAIVVGMVVGWVFYDYLFTVLVQPYKAGVANLTDRQLTAQLVQGSITGPFVLQMKLALIAGVVLASPVWLYQMWAFIMPGLHKHERRWTLIFAAVAGPLFMAGVALGYYVLPKGIGVLLSFTQEADVANFIEVQLYLSFALRMLIAFGIAFEIPLFVILLNLAGVVSGQQLAAWRRWIILVAFVFAAVATPSADPFSMLALAIPLSILFLLSEGIAHVVDRRRRRRVGYAGLSDDQASTLQLDRDEDDDRPSSLMDPD